MRITTTKILKVILLGSASATLCACEPTAGLAECETMTRAYNEFAEASYSFSGNMGVTRNHVLKLKNRLDAVTVPTGNNTAGIKTARTDLIAKLTEALAAADAGDAGKMTTALQRAQNGAFTLEAACKRLQ